MNARVKKNLETPPRIVEESGREYQVWLDEGATAAAANIFEAVEVDAPNERGTNMNELGLVIAHRLVAVLNGRVVLDTDASQGLAVRLELPAYPTNEQSK